MVNVNKLKGKIVERGLNVENLAERIGMDRATLYRKLASNGRTMLIRDADKIAKELDLSPDESMAIFFAQNVASTRNSI